MSASFPSSVRTFTTKRDGVDVNYASHINDLQDEVIGIENTLGTLPTQGPPFSVGGSPAKWSSVGARLNDLQQGKTLPSFFATNITPVTVKANSNWATINFSVQNADRRYWDTDNLWNGSNGFKLTRSGLYFVYTYSRFTASSDVGMRAATIGLNNVPAFWGADESYRTNEDIVLKAMYINYLQAGYTITLMHKTSCARNQQAYGHSIGGFLLREA